MNNLNLKYRYSKSTFRVFGYVAWFLLALLSIKFYKERAAFMDGAFQLVNLINSGEFSIHHYRLTNPLTQIFAWVGVKSGMPLKWIMIGYSLNFVLFHAIIYHLIIRWCKNDYLGIVQVGFFTLFVTQSFYFVTPEFYQGMSLLILWAAILLNPAFHKRVWYYPLLTILLVPIIFDHTLLSAFFLFIWIFILLHDATYRNKRFIGLLMVMIAIYIIHDLYFTSWYDEARKGHFWRHWNEYYPNFLAIPAHKIFLKRCVDTYYLFPILLSIVAFSYVRAYFLKSINTSFPILKLLLVLGLCISYLMLNHINDPYTPFLFYSQVNYIGLSVPLMVAFAFDVLPKFDQAKWVIWTIGVILTLRIITIAYSSEDLIKRHDWMQNRIVEANSKKVYTKGGDVPKKMMLQIWASPEETLLLSSMKGSSNSSSLLIKRSDYKYVDKFDSAQYFLRTHSFQHLDELNSKYFNLGNDIYREVVIDK